MAKVVEQLGLAESLKAKTVYRPALEGGAELVAKGEAEIGLYPTSEVVSVKGVSVVGLIPAAVQLRTVYSAMTVAKGAASPEAAVAFVKFRCPIRRIAASGRRPASKCPDVSASRRAPGRHRRLDHKGAFACARRVAGHAVQSPARDHDLCRR